MNLRGFETVDMAIIFRLLFVLFFFCARIDMILSTTDSNDAAALKSLRAVWQNTPPSWHASDDPCGTPWDGITCGSNSRVTEVILANMGIKGQVTGDIGTLTELVSLDLSNNEGLTGPLSPQIGNLQKLTSLSLLGCSFTGSIPDELGNLKQLTFLALNSNNFTGNLPASLGKLTNLYWLDVAENQLSGPLPVSTDTSPGLDLLINTKHFHFNKNQFSGPIPEKLFHSGMQLIHVLFDANQFNGSIPSPLGLVQTLEILRLDNNILSGSIPLNLTNLTSLNELYLGYNQLTGALPDLSSMISLSTIDLSNNSFDLTEAPNWLSTISSLSTLAVEYGPFHGNIPENLFSLPQLQQVKLRNNSFNGTLNMGSSISTSLQLVDLQSNQITGFTSGSGYTNELMLHGNPVCSTSTLSNTNYCQLQQVNVTSYTTSLAKCGVKSCSLSQALNPENCACAHPLEGNLVFRAPSFSDLSNATLFQQLEMSFWTQLNLTSGSVALTNMYFDINRYLVIHLELFPSTGMYFSHSEIQQMGYKLSSQIYQPPEGFGPYYFLANAYTFQGQAKNSLSSGAIAGISVGCTILLLALVILGIYAIQQKKRAEKATELSRPFASWGKGGKDVEGAPQLKGARWFSYDELKKFTNNFSKNNEIGAGGYGKVYRGLLSDGQAVAVKKAQQGSMQGDHEFKTEVELLSRVHHKNLVGLVGFCYEQGEQMLVYEFMPNGTLQESMSGNSGIHLNWKRRLNIALGSARGLAYLHDHANPPIIHRDVKSTNILLDEDLTAKVADFGLSKLVADNAKGHVSTQVKGTLGYLDPEYYMTQQLTEKSDVYSFGVVMLELITARPPIEHGKYIVREVRTKLNREDEEYCGLKELMDPTIANKEKLGGFSMFLQLALECVVESAAGRPKMSDVTKKIESILQNDIADTKFSSSTSNAGGLNDEQRKYFYDVMSRKEEGYSNSFDYSAMTLSAKIEPK